MHVDGCRSVEPIEVDVVELFGMECAVHDSLRDSLG